MNIVKISQKKLNNPEKLLKGRASVSFSDINGLLIRIFRRKKFIRIIYIHPKLYPIMCSTIITL